MPLLSLSLAKINANFNSC